MITRKFNLYRFFDPVSIAGIASSAVGALGGLFGIGSSNSNNKQQIRLMREQLAAQAKENQLNRDFNAEQARLARDWQSAQTAENRSYMSPVNQMRLLEDAGVNPSMFYSQGQLGSMSAMSGPGPSASYSGSVGSQLANTRPVIDPLTASQIRLNDSISEKNKSETGYTETLDSIQKSLMEGYATLQNLDIKYNASLIKLTENEATQIARMTMTEDQAFKYWRNIIDESESRASLMRSQMEYQQFTNDIRSLIPKSEYADQLRNQFRITKAQADTALEMVSSCIALNYANAYGINVEASFKEKLYSHLNSSQLGKDIMQMVSANSNMMQFNYEFAKDHREMMFYAQLASMGTAIVGDWISMIMSRGKFSPGLSHMDVNNNSDYYINGNYNNIRNPN